MAITQRALDSLITAEERRRGVKEIEVQFSDGGSMVASLVLLPQAEMDEMLKAFWATGDGDALIRPLLKTGFIFSFSSLSRRSAAMLLYTIIAICAGESGCRTAGNQLEAERIAELVIKQTGLKPS